MSEIILNNDYITYTEIEWEKRRIESHQEEPDCSAYQYIAYTVSLYIQHIISRLDACIYELANKAGFDHKPRWTWWNPIVSAKSGATLYLGALPLVQTVFGRIVRHDAEILENLGIKAVLSVTEPFENKATGLFLSAVTPDEWEKKKIIHLQLSTPDFEPFPLEKIHEGVEFIHWNLEQGRSVYVHCNAGSARSALIELCYLIKYHDMSAEEALKTLSKQRHQAFFASLRWDTAKQYEQLVRSNPDLVASNS